MYYLTDVSKCEPIQNVKVGSKVKHDINANKLYSQTLQILKRKGRRLSENMNYWEILNLDNDRTIDILSDGM